MREFEDNARDANNKARVNLEAGAAAAQQGISELQSVMLEAFRAHMDATLTFWRSLASASSLSEVVLIQTSGARRAYDLASEHWQRITQIAGRSMNEALEQQTQNGKRRT